MIEYAVTASPQEFGGERPEPADSLITYNTQNAFK